MAFDHRLNLLTPQQIVGMRDCFQDQMGDIFRCCNGGSDGDWCSSVCIDRNRVHQSCIMHRNFIGHQRWQRRVVRSGSHEEKLRIEH